MAFGRDNLTKIFQIIKFGDRKDNSLFRLKSVLSYVIEKTEL